MSTLYRIEENIARYIKENDISQKELCRKADITENALSLVANGKRRLTAGEYVSICNALCLPYSRFVNSKDSTVA